MATFVKVIRLDGETEEPAEWNGRPGHGIYDPDDIRTTTIWDLKTWICHKCDEFAGKTPEKLKIGFAYPNDADTPDDDDPLLWSLLQTVEENSMILYVWSGEEQGGRAVDFFLGPKPVKISSDEERTIIIAEPSRTARKFFFVQKADERLRKFPLTHANSKELYLFIEDTVPSTTEGHHNIMEFIIPKKTQKVCVKSYLGESSDLKDTFTLTCHLDVNQRWKLKNDKLENKEGLWKLGDDLWNFESKDNDLICIENTSQKKVFGVKSNGEVIQEEFEEGKAGQLWKKGKPDAEGYFTLENHGVPKVITYKFEYKDLALGLKIKDRHVEVDARNVEEIPFQEGTPRPFVDDDNTRESILVKYVKPIAEVVTAVAGLIPG